MSDRDGLSLQLCEVLATLLSRSALGDPVEDLQLEADRCGLGGRFAAAIGIEAVILDLDETDRLRSVSRVKDAYPRRTPRRTRVHQGLTERQVLILEYLAGGWRAWEIADHLGTGTGNVNTQVFRAKERLGRSGPTREWIDGLVDDGVIRPFPRREAG